MNLKVGDRIAVYDLGDYGGEPRREVGYVLNIENGIIEFLLEQSKIIGTAHPKQCRKLVKKKPA